MARRYSACLAKVSGSSPPVSFLDELVDWALHAPDEIFAPNAADDVYSSVVAQLGPFVFTVHRKAVMLEVLRVLAGHESTWNWNQGVDRDKKGTKTKSQRRNRRVSMLGGFDGLGSEPEGFCPNNPWGH